MDPSSMATPEYSAARDPPPASVRRGNTVVPAGHPDRPRMLTKCRTAAETAADLERVGLLIARA
jgi:hypothetical protein